MTIKEILTATKMSQTDLANRFGIPLRTVQNWCGGVNKPPQYVIAMICEILHISG